jgi:hypothetical protein
MTAPTVSTLPALPTFPSGPGLPDQPGVFIPQFLAFLAALNAWPDELNALATYLEGLSVDGDSGSGATAGAVYMPLVNGAVPPVFVQNSDGNLIYVRVE